MPTPAELDVLADAAPARSRDPATRRLGWLRFDPLLRSARGDPRYTALLRKMNLPVD